MMTSQGIELDQGTVVRYMGGLVNRFFKILPIKEEGEPTLKQYMQSLQREMLGCQSLIIMLKDDDRYMSLLSILQYLIDHDTNIKTTKMEVFRAINILRQLQKKYGGKE